MKNILIVEDERILAVSLRLDLEEAGYAVVGIASNADDALSHVKTSQPSLVLMDISIHGEKNGIDTALEIYSISSVPVIFLSGETDENTVTKAKLCPNCKGYFSKPVDIEALIDLISENITIS